MNNKIDILIILYILYVMKNNIVTSGITTMNEICHKLSVLELSSKKTKTNIYKQMKRTKKQQFVDEIFNPDEQGISNWKTRDELEHTPLKLTMNGNCRHGKFYNDNRYIWEKQIEKRTIVAIRTNGYDICELNKLNRPIRKDIHEYHKKMGCVVCGSHCNLVTDHKNDLYNDERVLNIKTQTIDDFQCLCNHCNLQKREINKKTRQTGKRYGATNIHSLRQFGIDFIYGDETFDMKDINAMKGTYWYDPVEFMKYIRTKL